MSPRPREVMVRQLAVGNAIARKALSWLRPGDTVYQFDSDMTYQFRGGNLGDDESWSIRIGPPGKPGGSGPVGDRGNVGERGVRGVPGNDGPPGPKAGIAVSSPVVEVDPDEALQVVTSTTSESYAMRRPDEKHMRRGLRILRYSNFPDWVHIRNGTEDELDSGAVISLLLASIKALTKRVEALEP